MNLLDQINFEGELLKLRKESSDVPGVSEIIEGFLKTYTGYNPLDVAKAFVAQTDKVAYDPKVSELRESITNEYTTNLFGYELESVKFQLEAQQTPFYDNLVSVIEGILQNESDTDIKVSIKETLSAHSYVPSVRALVEYANKVDKELNSSSDHYSVSVYSPIEVNEHNNTIINISGNSFAIDESGENIVGADTSGMKTFNKLVEAVNTFTFSTNGLSYYVGDSKVELTENEEKLQLTVNGDVINLEENWKQHLLMTKIFDVNTLDTLNLLETVMNNYGSIIKLDNVKQLHLRNFDNKKVNVITLENSIALNKIDSHLKLNELSVCESAAQAIDAVKDFMGYDLSESLVDYLKVEKEQAIILKESRKNLIDKIEYLKGEKGKIESSELLENDSVKTAYNLVMDEINIHTKELEKVTEKLDVITEKKSNFEDQGYIEGIMKKTPSSKAKKDVVEGDLIYIFAEDYTTSGAKDDIMIKLDNGKELKVKKETVSPIS